MQPEAIIEKIYEVVKRAVPHADVELLDFPLPAPFLEKGNNIIRGQILGKDTQNHIWNNDVCFYEIGVGYYKAAPEPVVFGGIGFVAYPNQKRCGGLPHRPKLERCLEDYVKNDSKFSLEIKKGITTFTYYGRGFRSFPIAQAGADLSVLISATFRKLNSWPT